MCSGYRCPWTVAYAMIKKNFRYENEMVSELSFSFFGWKVIFGDLIFVFMYESLIRYFA